MGKSSHSKNVCTSSVISNSSMLMYVSTQYETEHLGPREGLAKRESHCHWRTPGNRGALFAHPRSFTNDKRPFPGSLRDPSAVGNPWGSVNTARTAPAEGPLGFAGGKEMKCPRKTREKAQLPTALLIMQKGVRLSTGSRGLCEHNTSITLKDTLYGRQGGSMVKSTC